MNTLDPSVAVSKKPKLLNRVQHLLRIKHYSCKKEKVYIPWTKRFIFFHNKHHPAEMRAQETIAFLADLAVHGKVAASTQNQALRAILFLYREVLKIDLACIIYRVGRILSATLNLPHRMRPTAKFSFSSLSVKWGFVNNAA